ncbi:MAG: cache domain-containing protein, partial [Pseudomonadota bacterium]
MTSIRLRLLVLALLPLVFLLPLLLGVTMVRWINKFDDLLIAKVASDLRVAEQYFTQIEADTAFKVAALAQSARFAAAREAGPDALASLLQDERRTHGLDYLIYRDTDNIALPAPAASLVKAVEPDTPIAALALFNSDELTAISPDLALLAEIPLVPTEAARQIDRTTETRGMVLQTAYRTDDGQSVLLSGQLLNRNLQVIDAMNDLIYRAADESQARTGTTTLFLDDVRISTNVRMFEGARALGTRVSEVVWQQVMQEGQLWLDRAFVVNDWYISGYVP